MSDMKDILESIVAQFEQGEFVLVVGDENASQCYSTASQKDVYDLMLDVAKRMSNLPATDERVENGHLLIAYTDLENQAVQMMATQLEEFEQFLIACRINSPKFAVYGKGYPVVLTYFAVRTCVTMEKMGHKPGASPFNVSLN